MQPMTKKMTPIEPSAHAKIFFAGTVKLRNGEEYTSSSVRDILQALWLLKVEGKSQRFSFLAKVTPETELAFLKDPSVTRRLDRFIKEGKLTPAACAILQDVLQPAGSIFVIDRRHLDDQWSNKAKELDIFNGGVFRNNDTGLEHGLVLEPKG